MNNFIRRIIITWRFLKHDIWSYTNEDVRGTYRWLMNVFKAVYLSIRFFLASPRNSRFSPRQVTVRIRELLLSSP